MSNYRNGDPIPQVTDVSVWDSLTTGAYCYYNNDSATYAGIYGKLYNWYAVSDPRGLAPAGWHIPSTAELDTLLNCLGTFYIAGGKMKEAGTAHWLNPNQDASNSSGFTALPGGIRDWSGYYNFIGEHGSWWTSSFYGSGYSYVYSMNYYDANCVYGATDMRNGCSVRCIMD